MLKLAVVRRRDAVYPRPPFHPPVIHAELARLGLTETDPDNRVYEMVRRALELMGLDRANAGTARWNPLADLVSPRSRVVLKPNFVQHYEHAGSLHQLVTHPAVLRPILDYLLLAQGALDRVDVVDAPEIDCRFDEVLRKLGCDALVDFYDSLGQRLRITDIRTERADYRGGAAIVDRFPMPGDPRGFVWVDLGARSELAPIAAGGRFYGADYDRRWTNANHTPEINRYLISRTFLEADLIISAPKLKTHKKAGLTCAVKNLVGVAGDKNLLPHYTVGDALHGGCEYSHASASAVQAFNRKVDRLYRDVLLRRRSALAGRVYNRLQPLREQVFGPVHGAGQFKGDWWGNDILWRTILDLNKVLLYAGPDGRLGAGPCRRQLALVDAVVCGEGEGPHWATPRFAGAVLAGLDPVAVDTLAALLMNFDPRAIPQLAQARRGMELPVAPGAPPPVVVDDDGRLAELDLGAVPAFGDPFRASAGWVGRIERTPPPVGAAVP